MFKACVRTVRVLRRSFFSLPAIAFWLPATALWLSALLIMPVACAEAPAPSDSDHSSLIIETATGNVTFAVELADTDEKLQRGLMFREHLPADTGMLFDFDQSRIITMWMRNTPLPLDMIFITAQGRISHIAENTVPFSEAIISSRYPAASVFEVNAGTVQRLGIRVGDTVRHPIFE